MAFTEVDRTTVTVAHAVEADILSQLIPMMMMIMMMGVMMTAMEEEGV